MTNVRNGLTFPRGSQGNAEDQEGQQDSAIPRDSRMKISENKISENLVQRYSIANNTWIAANLGQENVNREGLLGVGMEARTAITAVSRGCGFLPISFAHFIYQKAADVQALCGFGRPTEDWELKFPRSHPEGATIKPPPLGRKRR